MNPENRLTTLPRLQKEYIENCLEIPRWFEETSKVILPISSKLVSYVSDLLLGPEVFL